MPESEADTADKTIKVAILNKNPTLWGSDFVL